MKFYRKAAITVRQCSELAANEVLPNRRDRYARQYCESAANEVLPKGASTVWQYSESAAETFAERQRSLRAVIPRVGGQ